MGGEAGPSCIGLEACEAETVTALGDDHLAGAGKPLIQHDGEHYQGIKALGLITAGKLGLNSWVETLAEGS